MSRPARRPAALRGRGDPLARSQQHRERQQARDIIGGLSREDVLTRRGDITRQLSVALEEATDRLGVRFGRVEIDFGR